MRLMRRHLRGIAMDGAAMTALISGVVAIGVVVLTHSFTRKRDREADWRKMKLEHYREYVAALSGIVHHGHESAAQRRYSDAVNSLALVAPREALIALYDFLDETSVSNQNRTPVKYELLLSSLLRNMREDCHPRQPKDSSAFMFRTINVPPETEDDDKGRTSSPEQQTATPFFD